MSNVIHNFTAHRIKSNENKITHRHASEFGKVAVLLGGRSAERAISLITGQNILDALLRKGVNAHGIDPDAHLAQRLIEGKFDRVFIALHGREGEDGIVQGLLEMLEIPYTGSGVGASALALDKARAKLIMHAFEVATPIFGLAENLTRASEIAEKIGYPVSIKPVSQGSSIGVTRVSQPSELVSAFNKAARYGQVMVEQWIDGKDFFVGILGDQVLPSVEVNLPSGFYDYQAKYESNANEYLCPAPISPEQEEAVRSLAFRAFNALGCEGWGRVDLIQDNQGKFWVLEVNTVPGMTSHSLVPISANAIGISFDDLVLNILETSMKEVKATKLVGELA